MTQINDIQWNVLPSLIDINATLYYLIIVLFIFLIYFLIKKLTKKDKVKEVEIKKVEDDFYQKDFINELFILKQNYKKLSIQDFFKSINTILLIYIFKTKWIKIVDLTLKNIKQVPLSKDYHDALNSIYLKQYKDNFDTDDFRQSFFADIDKILLTK